VRDRSLAEDVAQETFLLAFRGIGRLRDPTAFRAWLYRIAENTAHSGWRRRRRWRALSLDEGDGPDDGGCATAIEDPARPGEDDTPGAILALRAAMDRMPARYAGVLALHYLEGLPCAEVGRALGISTNNVKVRLHRARNALRRDLEGRGIRPAAAASP